MDSGELHYKSSHKECQSRMSIAPHVDESDWGALLEAVAQGQLYAVDVAAWGAVQRQRHAIAQAAKRRSASASPSGCRTNRR